MTLMAYSFGGDPNGVTLFGQSAGGASVHYHYLSPMTLSNFHMYVINVFVWEMKTGNTK